MLTIRRSSERGHADHGWLDTYHTFSFADYHDPEHMGYRSLRVINDDTVEPGQGFGKHGHRDMEILTWILDGALEHKDSIGSGGVIRPGELQYMSAGKGVLHSEFNASKTEPVHLLQIWILPEEDGATPRYDQKSFAETLVPGRLVRIASHDGRDGAIAIRQDVELFAARFEKGQSASHALADGRHAWVHVARGSVQLNGRALEAGDSVAVEGEPTLTIEATDAAEVLLFDLS
jgi:redox-sensitive bicupin YhaK (pirin superfamily)